MTTNSTENKYPFLQGGGELGELTRNHNWTETLLGSPDRWPQSLRTTVSILLKARQPMVLFWGPEFLCFYNDAYCPSFNKAGKHPAALGKPGAEVWPETWALISPLVHQALAAEDAFLSEQQLIPVYRDGRVENVSCTFNYSSVSDELGQPAGVLISGHENTVQYAPDQFRDISEKRFQNLVRDIPIGIIVLGEEQVRVHIVNEAYAQLIDRSREELLGKPLFSIIPESESYFRPLIDQVRRTGKSHFIDNQPYHVNSGGKRKEGFINVVYQPYREQDGTISGVMVLCQDVTGQRLAQQQLTVSESKLRSLIESAPFPIGVYESPQMQIKFANQAILDVWGKGNDVVGQPYATVLPELASQGIFEQLSEVYRTGVAFHARNERVDLVVNGTLQTFYFKYSFTPLYDENGQVYGVMNTAADVTDLVVARQKQAEAEVSLRSAIELAQLATWNLHIPTRTLTYSKQLMNWLGISQPSTQLDDVFDFVSEEYRSSVADAVTAAIQPGSSGLYTNEHPIVNRLTGEHYIIHVQAQVTFDTSGEPLMLSGMSRDVTQQRKLQTDLDRAH